MVKVVANHFPRKTGNSTNLATWAFYFGSVQDCRLLLAVKTDIA